MISARYTDCIYKISGTNGSVIWRLGGKKSSFELEGFNFSKQHDARFMDKIGTTEIISFLDNGSADGANRTTNTSSALLVSLDISATPMVARVVRRWERPDQGLSHLRGNFQMLPNNNAFVAWSDNSYISEHTYDGHVVMEAQFATSRFVTYRAYKSNFTGAPTEPPTLKVQVYGNSPEGSVTVCYVSWNGATEVAAWEFHRSDNSTTLPSLIGKASRTGFETTFQFQGFESSIYAEAISADGGALGRSPIEIVMKPSRWQSSPPIHAPLDVEPEHNKRPKIDIEKAKSPSGLLAPYKEEL
jgi:hypothetical protein